MLTTIALETAPCAVKSARLPSRTGLAIRAVRARGADADGLVAPNLALLAAIAVHTRARVAPGPGHCQYGRVLGACPRGACVWLTQCRRELQLRGDGKEAVNALCVTSSTEQAYVSTFVYGSVDKTVLYLNFDWTISL